MDGVGDLVEHVLDLLPLLLGEALRERDPTAVDLPAQVLHAGPRVPSFLLSLTPPAMVTPEDIPSESEAGRKWLEVMRLGFLRAAGRGLLGLEQELDLCAFFSHHAEVLYEALDPYLDWAGRGAEGAMRPYEEFVDFLEATSPSLTTPQALVGDFANWLVTSKGAATSPGCSGASVPGPDLPTAPKA
jgi:hypothetical protein